MTLHLENNTRTGDEVRVTVIRSGETWEMMVRLGERKVLGADQANKADGRWVSAIRCIERGRASGS